jgi:hypothetical protein
VSSAPERKYWNSQGTPAGTPGRNSRELLELLGTPAGTPRLELKCSGTPGNSPTGRELKIGTPGTPEELLLELLELLQLHSRAEQLPSLPQQLLLQVLQPEVFQAGTPMNNATGMQCFKFIMFEAMPHCCGSTGKISSFTVGTTLRQSNFDH